MPGSPVAQLSIPALFVDRCRRTPRRVAARVKEYGFYREVTWAEYRTHVERVCLGLLEAGVAAGDRAAIMGDPSIESCCIRGRSHPSTSPLRLGRNFREGAFNALLRMILRGGSGINY